MIFTMNEFCLIQILWMHDALEKVEMFVKLAILPELIGKWFTKQPVLPLKSNSSDHNDCTSNDSNL